MNMLENAPDLTKRAPRSVRARLGGFVILPRMLDKGRAEIAGTNGEYHYNCPLDKHFLGFVGVDPAALREQLALGKGDGEILQWIGAHATHPRSALEILQFKLNVLWSLADAIMLDQCQVEITGPKTP